MTPSRLFRLGLPAVVVVLVGAGSGWLPARSAASDADARADSALRLVDDLTWELEDLNSIVASAEDLRAERDRHDAAVPPDHQLAEFILEIEDLSDEVGLGILDIVPTTIMGSFDDPATPAGTSSVVIAVALSGGFAETIAFVDGLSNLDRLVITEGIAVGFDEVAGTLAVDLELRVFTTRELVEFTDEFLDDTRDGFADEFAGEDTDEGDVG